MQKGRSSFKKRRRSRAEEKGKQTSTGEAGVKAKRCEE
jgi:hypothetical protein